MSYINIVKAGTDHTIWMKGLEFYRDEIDVLKKRLQEVSDKNTLTDTRIGIEHFQNQFMIQEKNISDLRHEVRDYIKQLGAEAVANSGLVDESFIGRGDLLREKYENLELIMNSLRHEFNDFLSKWL